MPTSMTTAAILYHVGTDEVGFAHGADEDVSTGADLGEVAGAGVADGHGGVAVEEEHCHGFANDVAASNNHAVCAVEVNASAVDQFHDTGRGAGEKLVVADHNASHIHGVKCIHVHFPEQW